MTHDQISADEKRRARLAETKRRFRAAHPEYVAAENRRRRAADAKRKAAAAYQRRCAEIRASLTTDHVGASEARA
jgi:hypothetical protein